jgi:cell division transport system permease protein
VVTDPARLNVESLRLRLEGEAPAAVYDDHSGLRMSLVLTAERLKIFAFICLGLIIIALAAVLGLAAQAAVAANTQVIRTLRIVGARDGYIVGAFTRRFVVRALVGSAFGALVGLGLIAVLPQASEPGFFLVGIGPVGWSWGVPLLVPPVAAIIAFIATGWAVRRRLVRQA